MHLTCPQCHHQWDDQPDPQDQVVQCPECFTPIPLKIAALQATKKAAPPQKPASTDATLPPQAHKPGAKRADLPKKASPTDKTLPPQATPQKPYKVSPEDKTQAPSAMPQKPASGSRARTRTVPPDQDLENKTADLTQAPSASKSATASSGGKDLAQEMGHLTGRTIDGYEIHDLLGAGGMGAVFRARQISLDRDVAFKVLPERFAENHEAHARFTREALNAAQLNHHNVVQVYDVGEDQGVHYISMEFVEGKTLNDMIRKEGRLVVDDAASYILQAARGLQYAHAHHIIHRDIKPDNLMLNNNGVVKIADLGLAKSLAVFKKSKKQKKTLQGELKESSPYETMAHRGLGTPAYMAPEQAQDASSVDAKADQYSLGCTLYYLCAGKSPYSGTTAFEMITKHLKEPMTPLETHVQGIPKRFSQIVEKMLAKNPKDRYEDMGAVVKALETFLGIEGDKGAYRAREQHLKRMEDARLEYYGSRFCAIRNLMKSGFFIGTALLVLFMILIGRAFLSPITAFSVTGGLLGLMVLTPLMVVILDGILGKTALFRRLRSVFFGMPFKSWLLCIGGGALVLLVLFLLNWLVGWLAFGLVAMGLACVYEFALLRRLRQDRHEAIAKMQTVLKELRIRGLSEEALRDFVCRFSAPHWEEFFEEFFGYEAMVLARGKWASVDQSEVRRKFATWRDPIFRWLGSVEAKRRQRREKKALAKAELARLKAEGIDTKEAEKLAAAEADTFTQDLQSKRDAFRPQVVMQMDDTPSDKQSGKQAKSQYTASAERKPGQLSRALRLARLVVSVVILGAFALEYFSVSLPGFIMSLLPLEAYYSWGQGGSIYGGLAGGLLLLMVFSGRFFPPLLTLIGALLMVWHIPLIHMSPLPFFNATTAPLISAGLSLAGFILAFIGKMNGRKF